MQPRSFSDIVPGIVPDTGSAIGHQDNPLDKETEKTIARALADGAFPLLHQRAYSDRRLHGSAWTAKAKMLSDFMDCKDGCLVGLVGPRGTGKTQMATVASAEYQRKMIPHGIVGVARYARAMEFFMSVKEAYSASTSERDAFEPFVRPRLLILDEVQVRNESKWEDNALTYLVDARYGACKRTILISNQTVEGFTESMGDSIMSRISESGGVILCNWKSYR